MFLFVPSFQDTLGCLTKLILNLLRHSLKYVRGLHVTHKRYPTEPFEQPSTPRKTKYVIRAVIFCPHSQNIISFILERFSKPRQLFEKLLSYPGPSLSYSFVKTTVVSVVCLIKRSHKLAYIVKRTDEVIQTSQIMHFMLANLELDAYFHLSLKRTSKMSSVTKVFSKQLSCALHVLY